MPEGNIFNIWLLPYSGMGDADGISVLDSESGHREPIEARSAIVGSIAQNIVVHRMFARQSKERALKEHLYATHPNAFGPQ